MIFEWVRAAFSLGTVFVVMCGAHAQTPPAASAPPPAIVSLTATPFLDGPGPVSTSLDAIPFYHAGVWHVFTMQTEPLGVGHRSSRDLVHWEIHPLALSGHVAPGTVLEHRGTFYFFYTVDQTIHLATSSDLVNWQPIPKNPVAVGDGRRYVAASFRDPFVFFHAPEKRWWMLLSTQVAGRLPQRSACVGLYTSQDLFHWEPAEPLWAPNVGYAFDCPQLISQDGRWYLFYLHRELRYRVADAPTGPWRRPTPRSLSGPTSYVGSRIACDGRRWVSFPFLCALQGNNDFADLINGEWYGVPRQFDFHATGRVTERPVVELTAALRALPEPAPDPFASARAVSGQWDGSAPNVQRSSGENGTLLVPDAPDDFYLETDVRFSKPDMDANILVRVAPDLTSGYELSLRPSEGLVSFRPISLWENRPTLLTRPWTYRPGRPVRVCIFLQGTVFEAFIDDQLALSARVYEHAGGKLALEFVDGAGEYSALLLRRFQNDSPPQEPREK